MTHHNQTKELITWFLKTLAATPSSPNPKVLVAREVLAHQRAAFHPCTRGLCGGDTVVAATLIGYDDLGLLS
jgi:hypothetical protein